MIVADSRWLIAAQHLDILLVGPQSLTLETLTATP
jgi:hypothetical protein